MYIKIRVQWTYNDIHNNHGRYTIITFHSVGAVYINDRSKNELAYILLLGGTHNKQVSKDACVRIVVPLSLNLIISHKYSGPVLFTALCVKRKLLKIIMSLIFNQSNSLKTGVM